ncbi:MAG: hypothetical protein KGI08_10860, partial [Thaumarchaeota archaeon]|nr:hypothetical protein [Nitrososphaerota archaeon]
RKNITVLDLEVQDRGTVEQILVQSGFDGEVHYIMNDVKETPEETLSRFTKRMLDKNPDVAMIDSIGGYRPNAELEGEIGDRNVGQKALEMGQFSGRLIRGLQLSGDKPNAVFMTNHLHPKIGFMALGNTTTGGETKKYLSTVRIALSQHFMNKSAVAFGTSWLIKGKVDNNRFGYSGREFYLYMIGGEGVHTGLTAMWDCILYGYADLSSKAVKESTTVTMDGVPYGKLGTIIRDRNSEPERFNQFINVLKSQGLQSTETEEKDEE